MINSQKLRNLFISFFKEKRHNVIINSSLIPEGDPTVLFTTAGMHPLIPFLLGQPHPQGKRLVNVQKCLRTVDINEVGDNSHLTFFEMLGNWSLGDYFKKESIAWSLEFLTDDRWLGLEKERLYITVFAGDEDAPRDEETTKIWLEMGIPIERMFFFGKKDNWWGPSGATGPCGPDTEIFYDTNRTPCNDNCKPGCSCGKYFEIWNNVFMEYNKTINGKYEILDQKNVDTGMGVERMVAALQCKKSVYEIETFKPITDKITKISTKKNENDRSLRIITDHIRSSTFILGDENAVLPSNVDQGYVLRRLIRRAIRHGKIIGIESEFLSILANIVIDLYISEYPILVRKRDFILNELRNEEMKFRKTLEKGLKKFERIIIGKQKLKGKDAFLLFQSFGFPLEMTLELCQEKGISVDEEGFKKEFEKHQSISRYGAVKRFRGGLSDESEKTMKLHTATHLLNEALRKVLVKKDIIQKGSNITPKRLRFDFNFERKLTEDEITKIEKLVNLQIKKALPVIKKEMTVEEAKIVGAQSTFEKRYGEIVYVYFIGNFSIEICGGPHVKNTLELGSFRIIKEESIAAGVRRIRAVLDSV
jgi:alanyl-tRNA synthetase